jgi:hypothetical protein
VSLHALALALTLLLIVPAAAIVWRSERIAARTARAEPGGSSPRLDVVYAALPLALLGLLITLAWLA